MTMERDAKAEQDKALTSDAGGDLLVPTERATDLIYYHCPECGYEAKFSEKPKTMDCPKCGGTLKIGRLPEKDTKAQTKSNRESFYGKPENIDEKTRTMDVVITSSRRDRDGDIIQPKGLDFTEFKKNPVVLWAHDMHQPPIGKVIDIRHEGDTLIARVQFADTKLAKELFDLYSKGFLRAWSIGFIAKKKDLRKNPDGGVEVFKAEVIELSAVSVGSNPDALARGVGEIKTKELQAIFAKVIATVSEKRVMLTSLDTQTAVTEDGQGYLAFTFREDFRFAPGFLSKSIKEVVAAEKVPIFMRATGENGWQDERYIRHVKNKEMVEVFLSGNLLLSYALSVDEYNQIRGKNIAAILHMEPLHYSWKGDDVRVKQARLDRITITISDAGGSEDPADSEGTKAFVGNTKEAVLRKIASGKRKFELDLIKLIEKMEELQ